MKFYLLLILILIVFSCSVTKDCNPVRDNYSDVVIECIAKEDLVLIQKYLNENGYEMETNGEVTQEFKSGLRKFQQDNGLPAHGPYYRIERNKLFGIDENQSKLIECECIKKHKG